MRTEQGRAWIEVSRENLRHNVAVLQERLPNGCELMPVLKADAYGHGAVMVAKELNGLGICQFCVATAAEAVELRQGGIKGQILILGYTDPTQFVLLQQYELTQAIIDLEYAEELDSYGGMFLVQIAVDTGMHRIGERSEDVERILPMFRMENLQIEGIFSHLCTDDSDTLESQRYTEGQIQSFVTLLQFLEEAGYTPPAHLFSSYGVLKHPQFAFRWVRVGIALFGVVSCKEDLELAKELRPVLSLKARVAAIKHLREGEAVGYGLQYRAVRDMRIAVVTIGYADGIPRCLSCGMGRVLLNGRSAPIVGRLCMDQMMVEVPDGCCVKRGDTAVLVGTSEQQTTTVYDLATQSDTITNEILSRLGKRLNRIIV